MNVGPVFNAYTWGLQVCYCISYRAFQPLAGACCLGQETIKKKKKCVVCVFVCEAHFDTNCWKNNLIHFTEKSRFSCLIMQTKVYLVGTYFITLRLWASKVFSEITFFYILFFVLLFMPSYKALDSGQNPRNKVKIGHKKRVSCHFQLKGWQKQFRVLSESPQQS